MKRFFNKPLNLLFVLLTLFNVLIFMYLSSGIVNSDKQSNNFENIQKVKKKLLRNTGANNRVALINGF